MTTFTPATFRDHGVGADTTMWSWLIDPMLLLDDDMRERLGRPVVFVDVDVDDFDPRDMDGGGR